VAALLQHTHLKAALEQQLDYLQPGGVRLGSQSPGDVEAEWSDIWDVAHEAQSRSAFVSDMQRLRKRHAVKMAERAQQRAGGEHG
jgi:hypothetical protein